MGNEAPIPLNKDLCPSFFIIFWYSYLKVTWLFYDLTLVAIVSNGYNNKSWKKFKEATRTANFIG